jgi:hypothetical protein
LRKLQYRTHTKEKHFFNYHQMAEEGERHGNPEPSTSSRISAEVINRPATISTVTSRTPQLSIAAPTTTSYTVTPSGDAIHESLAAVLDKMQSATRALVRIRFYSCFHVIRT